MTSFKKIYNSFLSKMLDDEWALWTQEEIEYDLFQLLKGAMPWFKFPRKSLAFDDCEENFIEDLNNIEIEIIATYMKCEWLNRSILTWENVKVLYEERDFSQANLIDKLSSLLQQEKDNAKKLESIYYRSIDYKPFDYGKMAGE